MKQLLAAHTDQAILCRNCPGISTHQCPCLAKPTSERTLIIRLPGDDPYERLPNDIQNSIKLKDVKTLRKWLRRWPDPEYEAKQDCLKLAIRESFVKTIKTLLPHGAMLTTSSFHKAIEREVPEVFQQLLDH